MLKLACEAIALRWDNVTVYRSRDVEPFTRADGVTVNGHRIAAWGEMLTSES
jgi:hypothetical protein